MKNSIPALILLMLTTAAAYLGSVNPTALLAELDQAAPSTPCTLAGGETAKEDKPPAPLLTKADELSVVLGRPTAGSICMSVLAAKNTTAVVEYGLKAGAFDKKLDAKALKAGIPVEIEISGLNPNSRYFYRVQVNGEKAGESRTAAEGTFHTQRPPGAAFTFALQGDSHPERVGKMFHPDLYLRTLSNVRADQPDFYVTMGDDFSIDRLIQRETLTRENVESVYASQRPFLGVVGSSAPLFLVNGNHEHGERARLDGTPDNASVLAANARLKFFPLPAPDPFYTGDNEKVEHIGLLRDYYAWTWGDALFVVIDPYWHSLIEVDPMAEGKGGGGGKKKGEGKGKQQGGEAPESEDKDGEEDAADHEHFYQSLEQQAEEKPKGGKGKRDMWGITLGEAQYQWLVKTLTESKARFKFVFSHHVLGTGRGGIENADKYEWGGKNTKGEDEWAARRPNWELPIHKLFVKAGVTIFFQGHDHTYAKQELDGVIYQSCPNPADDTFTAFNKDAYRSGTVLPNSGHLRITVSAESVKVDYVLAFLPAHETDGRKNQALGHSYTVASRQK